jgi:hypothetical protein
MDIKENGGRKGMIYAIFCGPFTWDDMTTSTADDDGDGPTMLQPILLT